MLLRIAKGYEDLLSECCQAGAADDCRSRGVGAARLHAAHRRLRASGRTGNIPAPGPERVPTAPQQTQPTGRGLADSPAEKAPTEPLQPATAKQFEVERQGCRGKGWSGHFCEPCSLSGSPAVPTALVQTYEVPTVIVSDTDSGVVNI